MLRIVLAARATAVLHARPGASIDDDEWDPYLLDLFGVPPAVLPTIVDRVRA